MPNKVGIGSQIINYNYIPEFVAENLNKFLFNIFTPGVFRFYKTFNGANIVINEFSAFLNPKFNTNTLIKIDTMLPFTVTSTSPLNTYLVAHFKWITPPNGFDYDDNVVSTVNCVLNTIVDYIMSTGHTLVDGDVIRFSTSICGIDNEVTYYVINSELDKFQISESSNGDPIDLTGTNLTVNTYTKLTNIMVFFNFVSPQTFDSSYHIKIAKIGYTGSNISSVTPNYECYLKDNCINYDTVQRSGVRTIATTNVTGISGYSAGNNSGDIPISNGTINTNLNAEFLNGISAGNVAGQIAIKNNILSNNVIIARLFLGSYEYGIGKSGIDSYSGFSGYTGISGFSGASGYSSYSGYLPLNNGSLQLGLNTEYLGGYLYSDFALAGHTHSLDDIVDGTTYNKVINVNSNNLLTNDSINDESVQYRHQQNVGTTSWQYDGGAANKIFMLSGEIGLNGSTTVTFRKTFVSAPHVFLINNETNEIKSVNIVSTTGFTINHRENSKSDGGGNLVSNNTYFSCKWIAIGQIV